ncbi:MAG: PEP-CTERM sorting domain-containing protein [Acidobacteria bacterium]|nr:PEP-CTERM sorting domain-containing protein [Acidobacteriota bacterium]
MEFPRRSNALQLLARWPATEPLFSLGTQGFQFAALTVAAEDVPEPSAWLITLAGFGTLGAWVRTRRA